MQAVRLVQLGSASSSHALDFSEASINGIALIFDLRGVESIAGHQAVSLAIEVLQTILEQRKEKCLHSVSDEHQPLLVWMQLTFIL